jgi:hypothetical protein
MVYMLAVESMAYFLLLVQYELLMVCMVVAAVLMEYFLPLQQLLMVYMVVVELPRHFLLQEPLAVSVVAAQLMEYFPFPSVLLLVQQNEYFEEYGFGEDDWSGVCTNKVPVMSRCKTTLIEFRRTCN